MEVTPLTMGAIRREVLGDLETPDRAIAARYTTAAGQNIANYVATYVVVDFDTKVYDTHNAVTTGAAWKFTAPATGVYTVNAYTLFVSSSAWAIGEFSALEIYRNGVRCSCLDSRQFYGGAAQYSQLSGVDDVYLETGDYIDTRIAQASGGTLALFGNHYYNRIAIKLSRFV